MSSNNNEVSVVRSEDGSIHLTIPLTISVRLGGTLSASAVDSRSPASAEEPQARLADGKPQTDAAVAAREDPRLQGLIIEAERFSDQEYVPRNDDDERTNYYADIDMEASADHFFEVLRRLLMDTHRKELGYSPSTHLYPWVDRQPDGSIISIYTGEKFEVEELIRESFQAEETLRLREEELRLQESFSPEEKSRELDVLEASLSFNCEHVVPQSWFRKKSPMRGDLHHLFACEVKCNSFRGNTPYFDFADFNERTMEACGRSDDRKFEPRQGKAEVARATLYFLLRYPGSVNASEMSVDRLPVILEWARSAQPSEYERHRNAAIYAVQGNRNPLIDHPEWLDKIDFTQGIGS